MKKNKHFTLLELLMVIAVMILLAAIGIGGMGGATRRAAEADTRSRMEQVKNILDEYYEDHGHYPVQETQDEPLQIEGELENYFDDKKLVSVYDDDGNLEHYQFQDGFQQPFYYRYPGEHNEESYDLWSLGSDKEDPDTNITNW